MIRNTHAATLFSPEQALTQTLLQRGNKALIDGNSNVSIFIVSDGDEHSLAVISLVLPLGFHVAVICHSETWGFNPRFAGEKTRVKRRGLTVPHKPPALRFLGKAFPKTDMQLQIVERFL